MVQLQYNSRVFCLLPHTNAITRRVAERGGDHRDFEKLNAVGECFRQKTRELYCKVIKQKYEKCSKIAKTTI